MGARLSPRLRAIVDALPLRPGLRVLEIGCGPGAMAREIATRIGDGRVLATIGDGRVLAIDPLPTSSARRAAASPPP